MSAVKGKIMACTGLKNVDLWGKSDPFVHASLQKDGEVIGEMKTSTKTDELDPTWDDENFNFASDEDDFFDYCLVFKVMDTGLGPDVELGEAKVPIKLIPLDEPTVYTFSLGHKGKKSSSSSDSNSGGRSSEETTEKKRKTKEKKKVKKMEKKKKDKKEMKKLESKERIREGKELGVKRRKAMAIAATNPF